MNTSFLPVTWIWKTHIFQIIDLLEMNDKAIGVFDSGIGGLTVYKALKERMPHEKVVYLGDTARLPYGTKSPETIIHFSEDNARFLVKKEVSNSGSAKLREALANAEKGK